MHPPRPLAISGVDEALAEPRRAAIVDRQHGVAAIGEPLMFGIEPVAVARPGAAVNVEYERYGLFGALAFAARG